MLNTLRNPRRSWRALLAAAATALPAFAGFSDFKLARTVPADAFMAIHGRDHAGMEFVHAQGKRFWDALCAEHFEKDIQKMIREQMNAGSGGTDSAPTAEFDAQWQQMSDMLNSVDWAGLFTGEMAMSMKLEFPTNQFTMVLAPEKADVGQIFDSLSKVAQKLVGMAEGKINLATTGEGASVVHRITSPEIPIPFGLMLAREKGVVLLGFGAAYPEQVLALVKGEAGDALADTERYQAGFKQLPEPVDVASFVDFDRLFKQVNGVISEGVNKYSAANEGGQSPPEVEVIRKLMTQFDALDYAAGVVATKDKQTKSEQVMTIKPDATGTLMYKTLFAGDGGGQPLKYVPANAAGFNYWSGLDLNAGYRGAIDFISKEIPDGAAHLEQFNQQKAGLPFDIEKDLIELVGNKFLSFSMPGRNAYAPGDWVVMLGVNNTDHAATKLGELVTFGNDAMKGGQQGAINDAEIEGATGFKTVQSPMLMMVPGFSSPTFGIKDGWFWLGSSPKAIAQSMACAAGSAPSFETNVRFKAEGEPLGDNVVAASFSDLTKLGEELSGIVGMVPMIGMINPEINKEPAGRMFLQMATKMSRVLKKLDYMQSSYSRTTRDGMTLKTTSLMNYREPPKPAEAAPAAEGAEADKKPEPSKG